MKKSDFIGIVESILVIPLLSLAVFADEPLMKAEKADGSVKEETPAVIENIFEEIMMTLPADVKADLDSTKKAQNQKRKDTDKRAVLQNKGVSDHIQNDRRLKELPENVRKQVEQTILEIEKNREERALQFKEMKRKRDTDD